MAGGIPLEEINKVMLICMSKMSRKTVERRSMLSDKEQSAEAASLCVQTP